MKSKFTPFKRVLLSFVVIFSLISCKYSVDFRGEKGNGNITTQTRTISQNFEKIHVKSGLNVIVSQNDVVSVTVETDENIQPIVTTEVENGVLIVSSNAPYNTNRTPTIRISLPIIGGLKSSSGSTIKSANILKSTSLIVDSSSGSEIQIEVEADYISLESSSGSEIDVKGKALKLETASSSGSDIDAGNLMANEVFSQTSSGSSTKVFPILSLNAKASSGSDVTYKNIPKKLEKSESSGGSVSND